jgi:hypothetical protein
LNSFLEMPFNAQRMLMRRPTVQSSSHFVSHGVGPQIDRHLDLVTAILARPEMTDLVVADVRR